MTASRRRLLANGAQQLVADLMRTFPDDEAVFRTGCQLTVELTSQPSTQSTGGWPMGQFVELLQSAGERFEASLAREELVAIANDALAGLAKIESTK